MASSGEGTSFRHLPYELRKQIYVDCLSTDGQQLDATFTLQNDVLKGPPIMGLLLADKETHAEVFNLLFSEFRLCLVDTERPHRFILRSLLKSLKSIDRSRVKKIYLLNFTVQGLVRELESGHYDLWERWNGEPKSILKDICSTFALLPIVFPALSQLDAEFDVCDCLRGSTPTTTRDDSPISWITGSDRVRYSPWASAIYVLSNTVFVKSLDIRVFWHDRIEKRRREVGIISNPSSDKIRKALQSICLDTLRKRLPAKSLTGMDAGSADVCRDKD
ncbi:hypothetical protein K491DRAFT_782779 [Lophiostoma macrostomum CBS 122681]|uniref:Uncharacterized protein n=1 Tax=Lophiostoma macrostomum CBS 122681 TaxID=1314788 RepID=A0A6A6SQS0_9PLEO|nr:hypothetical protein K491DRAFT_782779 [Lophiostoma macrostomum CBS 122681]